MGKLQAEILVVKQKVIGVEKHVEVVEGTVKTLEVDMDVTGRGFDTLEATIENLDNSQCRNNVKIHGLKENIEGKDL